MEKQTPKWSLDQLVDALKDDAEVKSLPKCMCSRRSIEGYQTNPVKQKSARCPRPDRRKHLHEFLSEKISYLKTAGRIKVNDYIQQLAAIAPHQLLPSDVVVGQGKAVPLKKVLNIFQQILEERLGLQDNIHLGSKMIGAAPTTKDLRTIDSGRSKDSAAEFKAWLEGNEQSEKRLIGCAEAKMVARQYEEVGRLLQKVAHHRIACAEELLKRRKDLVYEIGNAFYTAANALIIKKQFIEAVTPIERAIQDATRQKDLYFAANLQCRLGMVHLVITRYSTSNSAIKHFKAAIKASRSALKYRSLFEHLGMWLQAHSNLGSALLELADRSNDSKTALVYLKKAESELRAILMRDKNKESWAVESCKLAEVFLRQHQCTIFSNASTNIRLLRRAGVILGKPLKRVSRTKFPELWVRLWANYGTILMFQGAQELRKHSSYSQGLAGTINVFSKARQVFNDVLKCKVSQGGEMEQIQGMVKKSLALAEVVYQELESQRQQGEFSTKKLVTLLI